MPVEEQRAGVPELERERGVDDVGRGQPVVEPAALLAELGLHGVDEGGQVVAGLALQLGDALGVGGTARARIASAASRGTTPSSAQASTAASSTSSQAASLLSSDQTSAMAGRE